ncbi:MAG: hypothetical protein P4L90_06380 [Rhodopila sp.]|nr:hypothetical protein [Rhodopila sp.]
MAIVVNLMPISPFLSKKTIREITDGINALTRAMGIELHLNRLVSIIGGLDGNPDSFVMYDSPSTIV